MEDQERRKNSFLQFGDQWSARWKEFTFSRKMLRYLVAFSFYKYICPILLTCKWLEYSVLTVQLHYLSSSEYLTRHLIRIKRIGDSRSTLDTASARWTCRVSFFHVSVKNLVVYLRDFCVPSLVSYSNLCLVKVYWSNLSYIYKYKQTKFCNHLPVWYIAYYLREVWPRSSIFICISLKFF